MPFLESKEVTLRASPQDLSNLKKKEWCHELHLRWNLFKYRRDRNIECKCWTGQCLQILNPLLESNYHSHLRDDELLFTQERWKWTHLSDSIETDMKTICDYRTKGKTSDELTREDEIPECGLATTCHLHKLNLWTEWISMEKRGKGF